MHLPQLGNPPLEPLIVPGPLHFRARRLPQIPVTTLPPFFIREIVIRTVLLLRISMTGTRSLSAKHVLLHHGTYAHGARPHELTLQTPPHLTELINPLTPSTHLIHALCPIS